MKRIAALGIMTTALALGSSSGAAAQENHFLAVGAMAPDVEVVGATRYGILTEPVRLSDFRGETVVLAFFFRVRTRG